MIRSPILLVTAAVLVLTSVSAQGELTLVDLTLGEYCTGERLEPEMLKGRTVVLDFWGVT